MAERSSGGGMRAIGALLLFVVAAVVLVIWLARDEPPAPAPPPRRDDPPAQREPKPQTAHPVRPRAVEPVAPPLPVEPPAGENAADPDLPQTTKLTVEVVASSSAPAAGAKVLLVDPFAQHTGRGQAPEVARAVASDAGTASFQVTERTLRVYAWRDVEAGWSDKFVPGPARDRVIVRLAPALAAKGRVVDPSGGAVAGAAVRFTARTWAGDQFGIVLETTSDAYGAFDLPPLSDAAVTAAAPGDLAIEARAQGWPAARREVDADLLRAGEVVVTLERGGMLRGRLVRPAGTPIAGQVVRLADDRSSVATDDDGRFELPLPRSGGVVLALRGSLRDGKSGAPGRRALGWGAPKLLGRFRGDVGDIDAGEVQIVEGQTVRGKVELAGAPVKAGDVALSLGGVRVAAVQTGDDGGFSFVGVGDDAHVVTAQEPPTEHAWSGRRHASVEGVRGGANDVRVVITGALTVLVKFQAEADRSPVVVPEVSLTAVATGATPRNYGWSWAGSRIDSVRFEVESAGTFDVTVALPGYEPATARGVAVSADQGVEIDVLFRKLP